MFKSKTSHLIATIIMLAFFIYLLTYVVIQWSSLMQTNRFRLFISIVLSAICIYRSIDYFLEWRNRSKPDTEAE